VSRWARHIDDLAAATAELLVNGPEPARPLVDPTAALVARDAVLGELRALVGAVSDVASVEMVRELTMSDLAHRPGQALHQALSELPRAAPFGAVQIAGVVDKTLPGYEQAWQRAAHATIGLEGFVDALGRLPEQHARNVLRDLADFAAALLYLDFDLAEAMLPQLNNGKDPGVPYEMLTHAGHDALRVIAGEIRNRVSATHPGAACARGSIAGPAETSDLDEAMTRYVHAVSACGAQVSIGDLRAATRLVEFGSGYAAQVLDRVAPAVSGASDAAEGLRAVSLLARQLRDAPARSMTAEHLNLVRAGNELQGRMKALTVQTDRLPGGAADGDLRRLAVPALTFARHVPAVAGALDISVREALASGLMLVPSVTDRTNPTALAWVTNTMGPMRLSPSAVFAAAGKLSMTARLLVPAVRRADEDLARHRGAPADLAQQALATARQHAGADRHDLRQVLAQRTAAQPCVLAASLPSHPRLAPSRNSVGRQR